MEVVLQKAAAHEISFGDGNDDAVQKGARVLDVTINAGLELSRQYQKVGERGRALSSLYRLFSLIEKEPLNEREGAAEDVSANCSKLLRLHTLACYAEEVVNEAFALSSRPEKGEKGEKSDGGEEKIRSFVEFCRSALKEGEEFLSSTFSADGVARHRSALEETAIAERIAETREAYLSLLNDVSAFFSLSFLILFSFSFSPVF